jgi:2-(1,2-epoxy-1,2-dihydrophenyl)acetyl-CoA isomerase
MTSTDSTRATRPYRLIDVARDGDVAIIRLDDPDTLNATSAEMIDEINAALDAMGSARALILTGAGRAFSSGANLAGGAGAIDVGPDSDLGEVLETHVNPLLLRLSRLPIPWISAVRGAAAGVGCSLALAADMVVASDDAFFLQAFARIGLVPDGGSSHLLVRGIGRVRAMELMLLGDRLPAARALEWGLVNRVVASDALEEESLTLARRLAAGPTRALGMIRELAWSALDSDWEAALATERRLQAEAGRTRDVGEGIAAFLEKRPAAFVGN